MKNYSVLFFALLVLYCCPSNAQKPVSDLRLAYIRDYNIKLDGGCSFYTYDTSAIGKSNNIFVMAAFPTKTAFIKVADRPGNLFLKLVSRHEAKKGISNHTFEGDGYKVTINTKKIGTIDSNNYLYAGDLIVVHNGETAKIKIHGSVDKHAW